MRQFGTEGHFSNGGLGEAGILDCLAFLVWLEPVFCIPSDISMSDQNLFAENDILLDGKFSFLAIFANSLVYPSICSTANESHNMISVSNSNFADVPAGSS